MGHQRRIQVVATHVNNTSPGDIENDCHLVDGSYDHEFIPKRICPCIYLLGSCIMDVQAFAQDSTAIESGGSVDGRVSFVPGGVCMNIARAFSKFYNGRVELNGDKKPIIRLFSVIGNDSAGQRILSQCLEDGVAGDDIVQIKDATTATVVIVFDGGGDVISSVADVKIVETFMTSTFVGMRLRSLHPGDFVVVDGDLSAESIEAVCKIAKSKYCNTFFEPVSISKSTRAKNVLDKIDYTSPNLKELVAMSGCLGPFEIQCSRENSKYLGPDIGVFLVARPLVQTLLQKGVHHVLLTAGAHGAAVYFLDPVAKGITCIRCPALVSYILSVSGAGDCLVGGFLASRTKGHMLEQALAFGVAASWESLRVQVPVPPQFDTVQFQSNYRALLEKVETHFLPVGCCCKRCMTTASSIIYEI